MDYSIRPSTGSCAGCGRELAFGTRYFSALYEVGDEGFERKDYCKSCWQPDARMYCYWRAKALAADHDKPRLAESDILFEFLEKLAQPADAVKKKFGYIVALALMRRRLLRLEETTRHGDHEVLLFKAPRTGAVYRVENPGLSAEEVDQITEEVGNILRGRLS
jgi:hypothetical protein